MRASLPTYSFGSFSAGYSACNAVFLETNSALKVDASQDVMDPALRHRVLHQLGFRLLDFPYVQPALSDNQDACTDLLLAVHESYMVGTTFDARTTLSFVTEFFTVLIGPPVGDPHYQQMV
jgi:hypothetical protein